MVGKVIFQDFAGSKIGTILSAQYVGNLQSVIPVKRYLNAKEDQ